MVKQDSKKEKSPLQIAMEKQFEYENKLKLVNQSINKLKEQLVDLEVKKYQLQGAINALSHVIKPKQE